MSGLWLVSYVLFKPFLHILTHPYLYTSIVQSYHINATLNIIVIFCLLHALARGLYIYTVDYMLLSFLYFIENLPDIYCQL